MRHHSERVKIQTNGRSLQDISHVVQRVVIESRIERGQCTVFIHHTSASLIISENADPDVRADLEVYLAKLVQDGDPSYSHRSEGADDMAAHIRSVLTQTSLAIPIDRGRAALGTWQGVYLWEHRYRAHTRELTISILGE
ncbi:MAG: secondary thiamine-phosphate synthase [Deltaproteobacteria bacterium CG2_30_63_29]|nr:MAG: secondary thiamine-phosphate synthase [Deltaproteobacteria bacterium CG2_30_63_29]PJB37487.1 MAG: secondary thiamine-phosphate synthase [Deltaproteobacteria bacterium CG_4_9_14_3_um_filter_63_12]